MRKNISLSRPGAKRQGKFQPLFTLDFSNHLSAPGLRDEVEQSLSSVKSERTGQVNNAERQNSAETRNLNSAIRCSALLIFAQGQNQ